ncbi:MBL fold metallo-hydrolase [Rhodococcus opacus]|uniref:MBL fold metallo-hydrolase n=1 Tax=Rhodococcus opacus TaxID=37919 RepID=UPI002472FFB3|nr:MBL fold metallo-hydrolase [Rhodococcus opacus]MDH6293412.1 L-ascorbate metabolism protein UlaG (beta-lactamase superfamily) [Rhodococcus opacus]
MELTKFEHATVRLNRGDGIVLIDPGTFTPDAADLVESADTVLITHEHADHFDVDAVRAGLAARGDLHVYGPAAVTDMLGGYGDRVVTVIAGDQFTASGFSISVFGDLHARIHGEISLGENVAFLLDGVYHPGDAYPLPGVPVDTLLMPVSGPWEVTELGIDFIRAVAPVKTVQIHDALLNDLGRRVASTYLGADGLTGVPMITVAIGDTVDI